MCAVVVAIPTFRRPQGLQSLLAAIASVRTNIRVIVADNDAEKAEGVALVGEIGATFPFPIEAFRVAERGIAQVRNALVAKALAYDDVAFIAMIDDDECPQTGWIEALLATQTATRAQIVGGPVSRRFEIDVPKHVAAANNYGIGRRPTGPTELVDATSNVLFDANVFRETSGPWFDPFFALTGGEDKDFMMSLKLRGKRFAWCDEARVEETLPASRCSTGWAIQRAFSTGNSDMLVNLRRRPPGFSVLSEGAKIIGALCMASINLSLLAFIPGRRFEGRRLGARTAGKLAALFGHRHLEYKTIHGR